jgi:hypothetical protein
MRRAITLLMGLALAFGLVTVGARNRESATGYRTVHAAGAPTSTGEGRPGVPAPPEPEPTTTTTTPAAEPEPEPTTTTTAVPVPGSPEDPWGPIQCVRLAHPAHHRPCPVAAPVTTRPATSTAVPAAPTVTPRSSASGVLACIRSYEQNDDPKAGPTGYASDTGNGYYGAYQFDRQTWGSVGGSGNPAHASASEQDMRAQMLYDRRGLAPWPTPAVMCR